MPVILILPITFATSERTFSALHRLKTYTCPQMTEKTILRAHKDLTDDLYLVSIAKEFIQATDERIKYFGNFKQTIP